MLIFAPVSTWVTVLILESTLSINAVGDTLGPQIPFRIELIILAIDNLNGSPVNDNVKSVRIPNGYRCRFWEYVFLLVFGDPS